jgi:hypothetical protein
LELAQGKYFDFNFVHMNEFLEEQDKLKVSYSVLRRCCVKKGIAKHRKRSHRRIRRHRARFLREGMLLQMDGSHHKWNGKDEWVLIAAIDDATSEIAYAEFFPGETTLGCMEVMKKIIALKGVPLSLYTDRAGLFGGHKRQDFSQFGRACEELQVTILFANSPQAKGRIERSWKTFQDRLIPELRFHKITDMASANRYLQGKFLPEYWNRTNVVLPAEKESHYRPRPRGVDLEQVFCTKEKRVIASDHTIQYQGKKYNIENTIHRSWAGYDVEIRTYPNGQWSAYYGSLALNLKVLSSSGKKWRLPGPDYRRAS